MSRHQLPHDRYDIKVIATSTDADSGEKDSTLNYLEAKQRLL
ncbi:MAG: hypothetical protein AAF959_00620 [Cyanobacteria bacterium P01_D01_bin.56]